MEMIYNEFENISYKHPKEDAGGVVMLNHC